MVVAASGRRQRQRVMKREAKAPGSHVAYRIVQREEQPHPGRSLRPRTLQVGLANSSAPGTWLGTRQTDTPQTGTTSWGWSLPPPQVSPNGEVAGRLWRPGDAS